MPITRLTCPHCEQEVDLNITSVTRSRDCPLCGRYIILQFTTKVSRTKRKALLMSTMELDAPAAAAPAPAAVRQSTVVPSAATSTTVVPRRQTGTRPAVPAPAPLPAVAQTLEGSSGERLQNDPEVGRTGMRLLMGVGVVSLIIALLVAADTFRWWDALGETYTRVMLALSPPEKEAQTQAPASAVDPNLPTTKEVLSAPSVPMPDTAVKSGPSGPTAPSEQEIAMRTVAAFLGAKSLQERMPMIRDAPGLKPILEKYYETHDAGPIPYKEIQAREVNPEGMLSFAFNVVLPNGDARRVVVAKAGDFKDPQTLRYVLDWSSFVAYSDMAWTELMEKRPLTPTLLRVRLKPSDYYNKYFPEGAGLISVELMDPLNRDSPPIYGYIRQGSPLGAALGLILRRSAGEPQAVTLSVKYPENSPNQAANQVWIDELLADGWIVRRR